VVRQEQQSGILWNATRLRQLIAEDACEALPETTVPFLNRYFIAVPPIEMMRKK